MRVLIVLIIATSQINAQQCPPKTVMDKCNVDCLGFSGSGVSAKCSFKDGQKTCETTWTLPAGTSEATQALKCPSATPPLDVTATCTNGEWTTEGLPAVCGAGGMDHGSHVGASSCCYEKEVGNVTYTLVEKGDTTGYSCEDNCIYQEKQNPEARVCFKTGQDPVTCLKEAGCKCGVKKTIRIIGGQETEVNEYPWIAALVQSNTDFFFCDGSLIASEWVLMAAHCIGTKTVDDFFVLFGAHRLGTAEEPEPLRLQRQIGNIIVHPYYDKVIASDKDIALLRLTEPVDLYTYTPVCLPALGRDFAGDKAWLVGWGGNSSTFNNDTEKYDFTRADTLMEREMQIVAGLECFNFWITLPRPSIITSGMLCANSSTSTGENAAQCAGDSGGPLTVVVNGAHILVGDVSFGPRPCEKEPSIGVYGNVAFFRDWIDTTMSQYGKPGLCTANREEEFSF